MACFVIISVREQRTTSSTLGEASQSYCPISCLSSIRVGFVNMRSGGPKATTDRRDSRVHRMTVPHRTASSAEIRASIGTRVTQRTVTNRLLEVQLRARRPVAFIPLTPNHCHLRLQWSHWWAE
ncbi:hypothetical protein AVEN_113297-1 [Araneus ventricosus]|uniref:Transposase Tc1-like domain-containing protein n=1 Tax=Araneus ventricosus TaxID=182803 RepID=A0A4Y2GLB3_ARAVE|nr:hypothetical protein AVEN_113297-1 [Araneus ventricosus]